MADNKPNKPDDKKAVPASETEKNKNAAPIKAPITADGKAPDNVVVLPTKNNEPEKAAAAKEVIKRVETADKNASTKSDKAADDEKLKKAQEALLKDLDEKSADIDKKNKAVKKSIPAAKEKPPAPAKEEKKEPDDPTLEERKAKLEQELREKYGIPKTDKPVPPFVIPETEQVIRIPHEQLHAFKRHTFNVDKTTAKFKAFVESIKAQGVTQPVIVRPDGKDKYEIISGHRRDAGGIEAGISYSPCIVRALNDEQSIQQMVEDNVNNRDISTMELARSLNEQLNSISRQGARETLAGKDLPLEADENIGKRSNEIIAERNGMSVKQVQRYIALNNLTPDLQALVVGKLGADGKPLKVKFTTAFELSYLKPENQNYIAFSVEENQSTPSLSQVQRMRQLDSKGQLTPDVIDGILMEEKKEVEKVIISSQELAQFFGKTATPRDMKDKIMELLEKDFKLNQKALPAQDKKNKQPEK